jgi:hypothetical protein
MATPPEEKSRSASYGYTVGSTLDLARLPIPGNAEFLIYVVVLIVFGLIALIDDGNPGVTGHDFVWGATWITVGYFVSRGLAKATRVLEQ